MKLSDFYLGTHQPHWLRQLDAPLFVSHRRLDSYVTLPAARGRWALDSGGFTELQKFGSWDRVTPQDYVKAVYRYRDDIGHLEWAAPQDWMCEDVVINGGRVGPIMFAGTHLSVAEHQRRTVANLLQLRDLAPDLPFRAVLQGQSPDDYRRHVDMYAAAGVDLPTEPLVALGSVCRRQATPEIGALVKLLAGPGYNLRLHGFGVKVQGLRRYGRHLVSADSLAWSYSARRDRPLPGCTAHRNCANCPRYAMRWREDVLRGIDAELATPEQLDLFDLYAAA